MSIQRSQEPRRQGKGSNLQATQSTKAPSAQGIIEAGDGWEFRSWLILVLAAWSAIITEGRNRDASATYPEEFGKKSEVVTAIRNARCRWEWHLNLRPING